MIGAESYYYVIDGEKVEVGLEDYAPNGLQYKEIMQKNADYNKYVASGMNNYESDQIYQNVTKKTGGASIGVYMVILLLVLIAMATFRSPAVAAA